MSKKAFLSGLLGGALGGILIVGGAAIAFHPNNDNEPKIKNNTKVSDIEYNVSSDTTKVIDQVQGGVVSVVNLQTENNGLFNKKDEQKNDDLEEASAGSGVIYKKEGDTAYIVTNNHVVADSDALQVILDNGDKVNAEIVGRDEYSDLAVLKIKSSQVKTVLTFGNSDEIKVGEPAIAIGSPLGTEYSNSVTEGIISAKNRTITTKTNSGGTVSINAIQTDAAINPGNSGGPLINLAGQVIGINSIKISQSSGQTSVEGMGFAIPSNEVVNIINQLEKNGKIERPALGITMIDLSYISKEQQKEVLHLPEDIKEGVIINKVQDNSPAKKANLKQYDVITSIDGHKVTTSTELQGLLYKKKIGDDMKLTYYRDGQKKETTVNLDMNSSKLN